MYDDLWGTFAGSTAWIKGVPDDQREWLEGLVDKIVEKGSEPVWAQVGAAFRSKFGVDRPVDSTLTDTVRKLVEQRG